MDKRIRDNTFKEKITKTNELCDECKKKAIILFDKDTKKFIGYAKKEAFLKQEVLEQFKDTPVKALVKLNTDGTIQFYNK